MGREIRRVIPNWEHPRGVRPWGEDFLALHDQDYRSALREWKRARLAWRICRVIPTVARWIHNWLDWRPAKDPIGEWRYSINAWTHITTDPEMTFEEWHGEPPGRDYYRPRWKSSEATWYQMYETVSEGTPVTPPFATKEELVAHLVEHGTFWDQGDVQKGRQESAGWNEEAARRFVGCGWCPSALMTPEHGFLTVREIFEAGVMGKGTEE